MGPEIWLLIGAGSAVVVAVASGVLGYKVGHAPVLRLQDRNAHVLAELEEQLAQGKAGAAAALGIVRTERRVARAAALSTADGLRMLYPDGAGKAASSAGKT